MATYNGTRRKLTEGLVLYTNELSHKSYPGEPTINFIETAVKDEVNTLGGFDVSTGWDFYRIYRDKDPNQQGMYKSLAPGYMKATDVVYKHNFPTGTSYNPVLGKHGFTGIFLNINSEYTLSVEVFVSEGHQRTGIKNRGVIQASPLSQASQYGTYDFSKKGTWQTVSILIKPSLLTGTDATSGTGGTSGSSGTSGTTGVIQTSIRYSVYMHPRVNYPYQSSQNNQSENALHGYILYKNFQLEKNKPEHAGSTHRTQFIKGRPGNSASSVSHSARLASSGLTDLSGNNNSFNIKVMNFDSNARPVFSQKGSFGSYQDIGITTTKSGSSSSLLLNTSNKKTYDFWVNLDSVDNEYSTLFYSDITQSGSFTSDEGISKKQQIYIYNGKVYCNFYNTNGLSTSYFTKDSVITAGATHNITVVVDTTSAIKKIKIYIDGRIKDVIKVSNIKPPSNITLRNFNAQTGSNLFDKGQTVNYKISSYDEKGESTASLLKTILIKNNLSIINLTWSNVPEALGFFVYRSLNNLGRFDSNSLLTKVSNPYFGGKTSDSIMFSDDNSAIVTNGMPKGVNDYDKYSLINNSFHDSSDLKASIGSFPRANEIGNKNYSEGKIYKVSIYKKALSEKEVLHNYIQGSEDFTSNSAKYGFSAVVSSSSGGY
ncbi:hypothetical protein CMI37_28630 [Candidatus Pacearchaeota archaeon]|nr:hypothetical protein [Candidatus Pacearchaeota archaeon]|tara:strand:+ start:2138 stop:4102 length:1965 start_codon:yes stop_codon:yes gene_type:complete